VNWDITFSGTQKCIGAPPGLAPITLSESAMQKVRSRKTPVQSWYLDMSLVETYWGDSGAGGRAYHHTAPSNALFGLYEAARLTLVEGLEERWARHQLHGDALKAGLKAMGLKPFAQEGYRLNQLSSVFIPDGIDDAHVRGRLLREHHIEIGGGLGPVKGQIWRIGTMGYSAQRQNIELVLLALENILSEAGFKLERGAAIQAAIAVYGANLQAELPANEDADAPAKLPLDSNGETVPAESVAQGAARHL
jgi:alanine-glyoxylate transaminase/serine-glyoxylate transaminase/serine-pyruvate transaminase